MDSKGKTEMYHSQCMVAFWTKIHKINKGFHAQNFQEKAKLLAYYIPEK